MHTNALDQRDRGRVVEAFKTSLSPVPPWKNSYLCVLIICPACLLTCHRNNLDSCPPLYVARPPQTCRNYSYPPYHTVAGNHHSLTILLHFTWQILYTTVNKKQITLFLSPESLSSCLLHSSVYDTYYGCLYLGLCSFSHDPL